MKKKVIIALADGFEEIEALTPIDFLRRIGFDVVTAGIGKKRIQSSHKVNIETDISIDEVQDTPDAFILPGGMPGSVNLMQSDQVINLISKTYDSGNLVASICAAAIALNKANIIKNKKVTAYPTVKDDLKGCIYTGNRVETDGNIITGIGPGASLEFAKQIAIYLGESKKAEELSKEMFII